MGQPNISKFVDIVSPASVQEQLGMAIGDVNRTWHDKLDQRLKPLGLSQSKWRALLYISRVPGGINQTELARLLGIEAPTLTRTLKQLEEAGWIRRHTPPSDARYKLVHVTAKARKVIDQIDAAVQQLRAETVGRLDDVQASAALDAILAFQAFLEKV
jgi:MarR family transcriptional regulator, transcriptional regulator for hemolysin